MKGLILPGGTWSSMLGGRQRRQNGSLKTHWDYEVPYILKPTNFFKSELKQLCSNGKLFCVRIINVPMCFSVSATICVFSAVVELSSFLSSWTLRLVFRGLFLKPRRPKNKSHKTTPATSSEPTLPKGRPQTCGGGCASPFFQLWGVDVWREFSPETQLVCRDVRANNRFWLSAESLIPIEKAAILPPWNQW